jgi:hypothetical protein
MSSRVRLTRRTKLIVSAALLSGAGALGTTAVLQATAAYGTPATGSATITTLNRATLSSSTIVNADVVQLHTHGPVDVYQSSTVAQPGWASGWHAHTGPVILNVKSGSVRLNAFNPDDGTCSATDVNGGSVYVERPGFHYLAQNVGSVDVVLFTTQLIPQGASTRIDEPAAC